MMLETTEKTDAPQIILNRSIFYRLLKRILDIMLSLIGLVILSPIFLITAIAIYIDDPGPILFKQERSGINGKPFIMWKFRSMYQNAPELRFELEDQNELDGPAFKITNDPRVTRVGKFIRRKSIDELPQLINILIGNMSIVGPRPLPTYETEQLTAAQKKRLLVKQGLICYWQISGRNDISFSEWMKMDIRYINEASILTDLKIIISAIPAVIGMKGAR
ncbi:sugar transferase [Mogibacterium sp. BX12]|uniref:Sugar transferase n=2 Tax=Zhenpiania hominis TaxID=2763644 RepID=A0A923NM77_9FIRM|nr:sugar transferase [Zhenpiania hominis]